MSEQQSAQPQTSEELDERFDESCKAIGNGIDRLQRSNAILTSALEKIAGGFINSNFIESDPPDWRNAFSQFQEIARVGLASARGESE